MNTFSWIVDQSLSTRLTLALVHFLWQGCVGGLLVVIGGWLLRGASARARYTLNVAVMLAMGAALPATFFFLAGPSASIEPSTLVSNSRAISVPSKPAVDVVDPIAVTTRASEPSADLK